MHKHAAKPPEHTARNGNSRDVKSKGKPKVRVIATAMHAGGEEDQDRQCDDNLPKLSCDIIVIHYQRGDEVCEVGNRNYNKPYANIIITVVICRICKDEGKCKRTDSEYNRHIGHSATE